jgi:predicted RNase H-like HicB family nuclease
MEAIVESLELLANPESGTGDRRAPRGPDAVQTALGSQFHVMRVRLAPQVVDCVRGLAPEPQRRLRESWHLPLPEPSSNPIAPVLAAVHTPSVPNARKLKYTVVLEEDPPRHWHAYAPAVPGCFGGGRTRAEALRQYRAALRLHLEELAVRGGSPPIERRSPAVQVIVAA